MEGATELCGVAFDHPVVLGAHHLGHCGDVCLVGPLAHRGLLPVMRWRAYSCGLRPDAVIGSLLDGLDGWLSHNIDMTNDMAAEYGP